MAWLSQWWTLAIAVLIVFGPGLVAAWAVGLRRLAMLAFAPVASTATVMVMATLYPVLGLRWTLASACLGILVTLAVLVGMRSLLRMPTVGVAPKGARWLVSVGLVSGAVLIAWRFLLYIGEPQNFSQSNDAPFHLGAIRAIVEHGTATSFGLGGLLDPTAPGAFYPGAWHAIGALVVLASGADAVEATNVLTLVVAAAVWPIGVAWLAQGATGRRLAAAAAGAMAPALLAFPFLMIQYGILYPYLLAVALTPACVALIVELSTRADGCRVGRVVATVLAVGMALVALALAQPSVLLIWALLMWLFLTGRVAVRWRTADARSAWRVVAMGGVVAGAAALAAFWWVTSHFVTADYWAPTRSARRALVDLVTSGYAGTQASWWMSVLGLIGGIVVLFRLRTAWLAVAWVALAGLYFAAAAVHDRAVRAILVGPWYSDTYRLAALVPMLTIVLAAVAVVQVADVVARGADRTSIIREGGAVVALVAACAAVFALTPVVQRYHVANGKYDVRSPFIPAADSWVTPDERALIARLPVDVADGARVIANPGTGAAFGYALSGVDVYPAKWQVPTSPDYALLAQRLREAASAPSVCAAVDRLRVGYVLDFGPGDSGTGHVKMPGMTDFVGLPGFALVDEQGSASLWRVTACAP